MPTIPLLPSPGALPDAPNPVLNRNQYPEDNQAPVLQGLQKLGNADQLPLQDPKAMAAPSEALVPIGEAIAKTGDVISALAHKSEEAQTDWQVNEANIKMATKKAQFDVWRQQNPDPTTWGDEFTKRSQSLEPELLSDSSNLTPQAKQQIRLNLSRFIGQWGVENMGSTAKQNFALSQSSGLAALDRARQAQNEDDFNAKLADMKAKGLLWPEAAQREIDEYKRVGEQQKAQKKADDDVAQWTMQQAAISGDPLKFIHDNESTTWPGAEEYRLKALDYAHRLVNDRQKAMVDQVTEGMFANPPTITQPSQIGAMFKGRPELTNALQADMEGMVAKAIAGKAKDDLINNGPQNAQAAWNAVQSYDRAKDPNASAYFDLVSGIQATVPPDLREQILKELDRRFTGQPGEVPGDNTVKGNITETIHNMVNLAIPVKVDPETLKYKQDVPATGFWLWKHPGHQAGDEILDPQTGQPIPARDAVGNIKMTVDDDAKQRNEDAFATIQGAMNNWARANPDKASNLVEARKALQSFFPDGIQAAVFLNMAKPRQNAQQSQGVQQPQQATPQTGNSPQSFNATASGYHPTTDKDKMEGGPLGAAEWHGQPVKQEKLYTLDDFREGNAPYVSVAMDNTKSNPLKYGAFLRSPQFPGIPFRVMDTGSAFNGAGKEYGPAKGLGKIDIARRNAKGANSAENNRQIQFEPL